MISILNCIWPSSEQIYLMLAGSRNAFASWDKMDTDIDDNNDRICIGPKDDEFITKMIHNGPPHRKLLQGLMIGMTIKAPLYWWNEFDTYRVGMVKNSTSTRKYMLGKFEITNESFSTEDIRTESGQALMDMIVRHLNDLRVMYNNTVDPEEKSRIWREMNQIMPKSYNYIRTLFMSYETAINMYNLRYNHPHEEWVELCKYLINNDPCGFIRKAVIVDDTVMTPNEKRIKLGLPPM